MEGKVIEITLSEIRTTFGTLNFVERTVDKKFFAKFKSFRLEFGENEFRMGYVPAYSEEEDFVVRVIPWHKIFHGIEIRGGELWFSFLNFDPEPEKTWLGADVQKQMLLDEHLHCLHCGGRLHAACESGCSTKPREPGAW